MGHLDEHIEFTITGQKAQYLLMTGESYWNKGTEKAIYKQLDQEVYTVYFIDEKDDKKRHFLAEEICNSRCWEIHRFTNEIQLWDEERLLCLFKAETIMVYESAAKNTYVICPGKSEKVEFILYDRNL